MEIHGECDPQFSKVKETFKKLYQEGMFSNYKVKLITKDKKEKTTPQ